MSVFVSVEDPEGEPLAEVYEVSAIVGRFASCPGSCLRFVSGAVDASFNQLQGPLLVAELESLLPAATAPAEKRELELLLSTCRKHAGKRGAYVRFYGEAASKE